MKNSKIFMALGLAVIAVSLHADGVARKKNDKFDMVTPLPIQEEPMVDAEQIALADEMKNKYPELARELERQPGGIRLLKLVARNGIRAGLGMRSLAQELVRFDTDQWGHALIRLAMGSGIGSYKMLSEVMDQMYPEPAR